MVGLEHDLGAAAALVVIGMCLSGTTRGVAGVRRRGTSGAAQPLTRGRGL